MMKLEKLLKDRNITEEETIKKAAELLSNAK